MANLFTSQTPVVTDANDGSPSITTATTVRFAQEGTVTGIRFYATTTVSGTYTALLYQVDAADDVSPAGTLLASKALGSAPTGGTWNTITFDAPVSVTTGVLYRACIFSSAGRYVATTLFFALAVTNGDITADANGDNPVGLGTLRQGTFLINAAAGYPSGAGNGTSYFVDVEFTAGAAPLAPNGIEVPVSLGAPVAAFTASAAPAGIEVPVTIGAPTLAFNASASPNGIEVALALGAPTVRPTVFPAGISAPFTLGEPAIDAPPGPAPEQDGSWYGLLNVLQSARADHQINAERDAHPLECPWHGWPLDRSERGLHCRFGGHLVKGS
jgi:hypothetical protein